jgi:phage shock protein A
MGEPHDPLGPERSVPPANAAGDARPTSDNLSSDAPAHPSRLLSSGRLSRLDEEIEALRRRPTPTQSRRDSQNPDSARVGAQDRVNSFLDGVAFMGIFSRTRDISAANFNDMLDKADDPTKMIRMIILEMEETLVEVRASAARTIADQKEMHRHCVKLDRLQADWSEKAQLALSKDREDLARAALVEKKKAGDMSDQLKAEIAVLDDALRDYIDRQQKDSPRRHVMAAFASSMHEFDHLYRELAK